ncbi:uncharacterized protein LOC110696320 isoform X2 [Chenopodium quinoa]|uniref:uncharacterized protein LOC110696320 isoform X2 n=1 Tax=Chenopodium quinoa TaxID=63459 RepID=UPI000B779B0D|nr:uncharacterized protein LOC110696320 isoform X2 [Chenopodium quinoa]
MINPMMKNIFYGQLSSSFNSVVVSLQNHRSNDQSTTNEFEGVTIEEQPHIPLLLQKSNERSDSSMHDELRHFRRCLKWCALDLSSSLGKNISYLTFVILAIIIPILTTISIKIPSSSSPDKPLSFNKLVQLPESGLAFIGFLTLYRFFKEYGLKQLLFLDGLNDDSLDVQLGYKYQVDKAFKSLAFILLPSFIVEFVHKILFFSAVVVSFPVIDVLPINTIMFISSFMSWVYRTGVFLLVCVLFRLICELQILRLEGLRHMFEGSGSEPCAIYLEHRRIRDQFYVTSHRFWFFIVGCMVTITVSQLGALLLVLASKSDKNFLNSGDLVVCSAKQLSGFFLCLMGAARITHRAQGIVSVATRWHMLMTSCFDSTNHNKVTYLQHNNGGITLFGFALDRGMLHTLFAFEMSLVLWILSKAIVLS